MASSSRNITIIFAAIGFLHVLCTIEGLDTARIRLICSGENFKSIYSLQQLGETIDDVLTHTPTAVQHNYYLQKPCDGGGIFCVGFKYAYGHGKCTATLIEEDCKSCMEEAYEQLFQQCTHSMGAQIQLTDCRLRYETYEFTDDE